MSDNIISPKKLEVLVNILRREVLRHYSVDSCIATVKTLIEMLKMSGLAAKPLQVECLIANKVWEERYRRGDPPLKDPEAWSVALGVVDSNGDGRAMHVIAWVPQLSVIIDPSLDQASRPQHNLVCGPTILGITGDVRDKFLKGNALSWERTDGTTIRYRVLMRKDYAGSPNWNERDKFIRLQILDAVATIVEKLMEEGGKP